MLFNLKVKKKVTFMLPYVMLIKNRIFVNFFCNKLDDKPKGETLESP